LKECINLGSKPKAKAIDELFISLKLPVDTRILVEMDFNLVPTKPKYHDAVSSFLSKPENKEFQEEMLSLFSQMRSQGSSQKESMVFALIFLDSFTIAAADNDDVTMLRNLIYLAKGMERLFESDLSSGHFSYIYVYVLTLKFLGKQLPGSLFEQMFLTFCKYYLYYAP
jgi:hypothetical protein